MILVQWLHFFIVEVTVSVDIGTIVVWCASRLSLQYSGLLIWPLHHVCLYSLALIQAKMFIVFVSVSLLLVILHCLMQKKIKLLANRTSPSGDKYYSAKLRLCVPLWVLEHSSPCCCSDPNEGTLVLCISVYAVSVDVLSWCMLLIYTKQVPVSGLWVHDV